MTTWTLNPEWTANVERLGVRIERVMTAGDPMKEIYRWEPDGTNFGAEPLTQEIIAYRQTPDAPPFVISFHPAVFYGPDINRLAELWPLIIEGPTR